MPRTPHVVSRFSTPKADSWPRTLAIMKLPSDVPEADESSGCPHRFGLPSDEKPRSSKACLNPW